MTAKPVSIYVATCAVTGKQYVGITRQLVRERRSRHWQEALKKGSQTPFHRSIRKHGKQAFSFEHVASTLTWDNACGVEKQLISELGTIAPGGYNLSAGGQGEPNKFISEEQRAKAVAGMREYWKTHKQSPEHIRASAEAKRGRKYTPEHRAAISAGTKAAMASKEVRERVAAGVKASYIAKPERRVRLAEIMRTSGRAEKLKTVNIGRKQKPETVAKRTAANTGKKRTLEQRAAFSAAQKALGKKLSPEHRAHISKIQTGRLLSAATKAKISLAGLGRKASAETRKKMSQARIGMKFTDEHRANISAANQRRIAARAGGDHVGT